MEEIQLSKITEDLKNSTKIQILKLTEDVIPETA
jgi:hypothetical protein